MIISPLLPLLASAALLAPAPARAEQEEPGLGAAQAARERATGPELPAVVVEAVERALTIPGASLEIVESRQGPPPGCTPDAAEVRGAIGGSGRVAAHVKGKDTNGAPCSGWSWVEVSVEAPVWITTRPIAEGEALAEAVRSERREIKEGRRPITALGPEARASRSLAAGVVLEDSQVATGLLPGERVQVELRTGALSIRTEGRGVACGRDRTCATLPTGKRVEGRLEGERLVVEGPSP